MFGTFLTLLHAENYSGNEITGQSTDIGTDVSQESQPIVDQPPEEDMAAEMAKRRQQADPKKQNEKDKDFQDAEGSYGLVLILSLVFLGLAGLGGLLYWAFGKKAASAKTARQDMIRILFGTDAEANIEIQRLEGNPNDNLYNSISKGDWTGTVNQTAGDVKSQVFTLKDNNNREIVLTQQSVMSGKEISNMKELLLIAPSLGINKIEIKDNKVVSVTDSGNIFQIDPNNHPPVEDFVDVCNSLKAKFTGIKKLKIRSKQSIDLEVEKNASSHGYITCTGITLDNAKKVLEVHSQPHDSMNKITFHDDFEKIYNISGNQDHILLSVNNQADTQKSIVFQIPIKQFEDKSFDVNKIKEIFAVIAAQITNCENGQGLSGAKITDGIVGVKSDQELEVVLNFELHGKTVKFRFDLVGVSYAKVQNESINVKTTSGSTFHFFKGADADNWEQMIQSASKFDSLMNTADTKINVLSGTVNITIGKKIEIKNIPIAKAEKEFLALEKHVDFNTAELKIQGDDITSMKSNYQSLSISIGKNISLEKMGTILTQYETIKQNSSNAKYEINRTDNKKISVSITEGNLTTEYVFEDDVISHIETYISAMRKNSTYGDLISNQKVISKIRIFDIKSDVHQAKNMWIWAKKGNSEKTILKIEFVNDNNSNHAFWFGGFIGNVIKEYATLLDKHDEGWLNKYEQDILMELEQTKDSPPKCKMKKGGHSSTVLMQDIFKDNMNDWFTKEIPKDCP